MIFTGEPIAAEVAERWGLANEVVPGRHWAIAQGLSLKRSQAMRPLRCRPRNN
jgi:enoyl-CoA hydratase/carnithine racemase